MHQLFIRHNRNGRLTVQVCALMEIEKLSEIQTPGATWIISFVFKSDDVIESRPKHAGICLVNVETQFSINLIGVVYDKTKI